ncbi:protein kinase (macronuclear) [Tetrahymena thermophila SB210]|uniref:Protein kinase n=1 Tax=Tetrahymena thermophila (strain SB210) TaxID=312017 RepID=I7MHV8_TETTS|nr:protein kinase [Tetrahymena thermophila SB210]EAR89931.2 protein kinase [Tetrahymena thermophila SB210]|eukprot:XP_001010176.2 protein kinase [Tetrahymena thermophila SB210]
MKVSSSGQISLVEHKISREKFILKEVQKKHISNISQFYSDIGVVLKIDHPNILKVFQVYESIDKFHIVEEYCQGGSVLEFVAKKQNYNERQCAKIVQQICSALLHSHQKAIIHQNIKSSKILLKYKNDDNSIKLIDLGINLQSKDKKQSESQLPQIQELPFLAPEQLEGRNIEVSNSWNVGVFLYILFSGQHPFQSLDPQKSLDQIKKGIFTFTKQCFHNCSVELKDLLSKLLTKNERKRISIKQCLDHEWIIQSDNSPIFDQSLTEKTFANLKKFYSQFIDEVDYEEEQRLNALKRQQEEDERRRLEEERRRLEEEMRRMEEEKERLRRLQEEEEQRMKLVQEENLKRRMLMSLVGKIPQHYIDKLQAVFTAIDENGNGQLSLDELLTGMARFQSGANKFSEEELKDIFQKMDEDNSGEVSQEEFIHAFAEQFSIKNKNMILQSFKQLDQDGSGIVNLEEFTYLLQNGNLPLGEVSVEQILGFINDNNQGKINYIDFFEGLQITE